MGLQESVKLLGGTLRASIGMEDHRLRTPSLPYGHQDGLHDPITSQLWLHRPPNPLPRKQIEDDCQMDSAFLRGNNSNIGDPFGIRKRCGKVPSELTGDPSLALSGFPSLPVLRRGNALQALSSN